VALSLPPFGWWPLAFAGFGALAVALGDQPVRRRLLIGAAFGLGQFTIGLWWMGEFNLAGSAAVVALQAVFLALAAALAPPGAGRAVALPGALVLVEAARGVWPFGGLPMAGAALGQVAGPLGATARVGGQLGLVVLTATAGVALAAAVGRRWTAAGVAAAVVVAGGVLGRVAPDGGSTEATVVVAAVQGGGARGFRAADVDEALVFEAQLSASRLLEPPLDLVLWPEDVVDAEGPVGPTPEAAVIAAEARRLGATVVAGVIEGEPPAEGDPDGVGRFRNAAVGWGPGGDIVARYEKVHRVPFGEYIPGRAFFDRLADLSPVPRDAIAGSGPGLLRTPAGELGVLISYEVFFADRARAAVRAGGRLLLVPTNAASFETSQVPLQELAAARLRAVESGRDLLQAAPTGASAVVDHHGRVLAVSTLGERLVVRGTVALRGDRTVYTVIGDWPLLALAAAALCGAWGRAAAAVRRAPPRRAGSRRGR
jgi:apolipoprotein N-acyltransferase